MTALPSFDADCDRCVALCCLALAFDRGDDFAIDKPAGVACPNLDGHGCSIHETLEDAGFGGCVRYSCHGAGQRVAQELFDGQSWQSEPALTGPMITAFRGMRELQERLMQLTAAKALPLSDQDRAALVALTAPLLPGGMDQLAVRDFPGSALRTEIDRFVTGLRRYVSR
ncbi:hypothetical protein ACRARG_00220 [Pseudooceanicola sp. C21-150M6]|uniref:hypothetical protein n=1 Tax=Pseudooceanicola sp. C21-150M6 TaxID=3434355 RepID=UPI003D7F3442